MGTEPFHSNQINQVKSPCTAALHELSIRLHAHALGVLSNKTTADFQANAIIVVHILGKPMLRGI